MHMCVYIFHVRGYFINFKRFNYLGAVIHKYIKHRCCVYKQRILFQQNPNYQNS